MNTKWKFKRATAIILTAAMCVTGMPAVAFADSETEALSADALRVSDEFAAKYPGGLLDIVNQNTITEEGAGEIHFYVARRGGTEGEVDVSVKAIEMTAKYGEDFVFMEEGFLSSHEVAKTLDTPTLLESSIADYGDEPVTVSAGEIKAEEETTEKAASSTVTTNVDEVTKDSVADIDDENRKYASSLHQMRDSILGKSTAADATTGGNLTEFFDTEGSEDDIKRDEAMSAVMPGAFINLHFDEGENYKIITIKIIDDDIVEDEETFMLGLYDCTGAELGNSCTSSVCIQDNDEKSDETELYFEDDNIEVEDGDETARLKVLRSNNIETSQLLDVKTMGASAKADVNYSSLVTEAVLLSGQEYKIIEIPLIESGITEPVNFEVHVGAGGASEAVATVTINPAGSSAEGAANLQSWEAELAAGFTQPKITIEGKNFNDSSYADTGKVRKMGSDGLLALDADYHRWGYLYYDLDLRGIESIKVKAEGSGADTKYPSRTQHHIYVEGGGKTVYKEKNWGPEEFTFTSSDFAHMKTRLVAKAESWWYNDMMLWVSNIELYKQRIILSFEQPDTFKIPIYSDGETVIGYYQENGSDKVIAPQSSISALNNDSTRPLKYYRDDTLTFTSTLSSDGEKYGAYLKGYELFNSATQKYTYFEGTSLTLTPDIIGTYVYGDNKNYSSVLRIKPVYGRKSVDSVITAGNYASYKGSMSFGAYTLNPNSDYECRKVTGYTNVTATAADGTSKKYVWLSLQEYNDLKEDGWTLTVRGERIFGGANWKVGDYIAVKLSAADGYTAASINDADGNQISEGSSNTMYVQLKERGNCLVPVFSRNDCGVTFIYEGNTEGLYIFHDQVAYADNNFISGLYTGTSGLSNWSDEENPLYTGILNAKIKSNYDVLRNKNLLNGQKLSNLTIGDVVTVYAEAPDGYIPYWYVDDGQDTITTDNDKIYAKHYGNSFSFEMTSNDVTLRCGMEKKTATDYVMTGKLVKPSKTLKGGGYAQVNPQIPDSYMAVPGASVSVVNFDESKNSTEIDGVKYYSSVTTDKEGNFKMYIPNVSEREYFSVKYTNGKQTKAKTLLAASGKVYYIAVPANDENYTVKSIDCRTMLGDLAETNGTIEIPYTSTGANRSFIVSTVSSNENYAVGAVKLNSYRGDGSKITSVDMTQTYSAGLEGYWRCDVNIAEILEGGGRITVEAFDKNGGSRGEVETGYTLEQAIAPTSVSIDGMPEEFSSMGTESIPIVGSNVPTVPGSSFVVEPDSNTLEIAVWQGKTLKNAIYSQLEAFDNSDSWSKLIYLSNYITDTYGMNIGNEKTETPNGDGTYTKTIFPMQFDFGMYMKLDKNADNTLSLDYIFVTLGFTATKTKEWQWLLCGIPVYVTLTGSGTARGLIGICGSTDYFSAENVYNDEFYALLGKYGRDEIPNGNYSTDDEAEQKLFAALYNQANLTAEMSQYMDAYTKDFISERMESTASAIDKLLDRYDFYYLNEEIFEAKADSFSGDLQNRIAMYKQLVTVIQRIEDDSAGSGGSADSSDGELQSNIMVSYDAEEVSQSWIHRLNLLLLLESLPEYLDEGKSSYDLTANNYFGLGNDSERGKLAVTGIVSLRPSFAVGAGVGVRGIISLGVSGHIDFVVNWEPWSEARGTVTFAVNADVYLLVIPISVRLAGYTIELFKTDGYLDNKFDTASGGSGILTSLMGDTDLQVSASVNTSPKRRSGGDRLEQQASLQSSYDEGITYRADTVDYQTQTTTHPQPHMYILPNGNKLLIYMNDTLERGTYDRNSVYYSVFDKNTKTWSVSEELEADGTLDGDIETMQLADGRVVLVWTNSDETFGDELPELADLVTSQNISMCVFDGTGEPGEIYDITELENYGYSEPALSYQDGILTIAYKITDYHTDGAEFSYDDIEGTYQTFMTNSYESLAITKFDIAAGRIVEDGDADYAAYEASAGVDLNGMRFVDTDIAGLENPKLYDIKAASYDGKTYIVYTADMDKNTSTKDDRELFCVIISGNGTVSNPIRLTDNQVNDANANIVVSDDLNKIYFGSGGDICGLDLASIDTANCEDMGSYYTINGIDAQPDSVLEYESEEAADGFSVTVGQNGLLYMLWSEFKTSTDDEGKTHKSRALYMKAYDPKFTAAEYEDAENGTQTVYTGAWGLTNELLLEEDRYINEPVIVVSADDEYSLAYRIFEKESFEADGTTYEKEADTSTLCISDFALVTSVSAKQTNQYPLYPCAGDTVSLDFECENYGSIPTENVDFKYYVVTDAEPAEMDGAAYNWSRGDGKMVAADKYYAEIADEYLYDGHVASGTRIGGTVQFVMPEYEDEVSVLIVASESGTVRRSKALLPITVAAELVADNLTSSLSADGKELAIKGSVRNAGNHTAKNVVLSIYADGSYDARDILLDNENTKFSEADINVKIGEISIGSLQPGESYDLQYFAETAGDSEAFESDGSSASSDSKNDGLQDQSAEAKNAKISGSYFTSDGTATFTLRADYEEGSDATENSAGASDGNPSGSSAGSGALAAPLEKKSAQLGSTAVRRNNSALPSLTGMSVSVRENSVGAYGRESDNDGALQAGAVSLQAGDAVLMTDDASALKLAVGESLDLNVSMEPYGSSKGYSLIYESADASIADINSSNGKVTGVSKGKTSVSVKAVKNDADSIVLVDDAGDFWLTSGEVWDFANDTVDTGGEVVMTKEISVEVTAGDSEKGSSSHKKHKNNKTQNVDYAADTAQNPADDAEKVADGSADAVQNGSQGDGWFKDVPEDAWHYDAIKFAFDKGLMLGMSDAEFLPDGELTRAMFVTVLYRLEKMAAAAEKLTDEATGETDTTSMADVTDETSGKTDATDCPFEDVDAGSWYADAVCWAAENGIVKGISDTKYAPNDSITREQMAAIIARYADYKGLIEGSEAEASEETGEEGFSDETDGEKSLLAVLTFVSGDTDSEVSEYTDSDRISDWAREAVAYCTEAGFMQGKADGSFAPSSVAKRAETAVILQRLWYAFDFPESEDMTDTAAGESEIK